MTRKLVRPAPDPGRLSNLVDTIAPRVRYVYLRDAWRNLYDEDPPTVDPKDLAAIAPAEAVLLALSMDTDAYGEANRERGRQLRELNQQLDTIRHVWQFLGEAQPDQIEQLSLLIGAER